MRDGGWAALGEPVRPGAYDGLGGTSRSPTPRLGPPIAVDVSRTGDTVAVGSPFHDAADASDAGQGGGVQVDVRIVGAGRRDPITGSEAGAYFGASVSLSGDGGASSRSGAPGIDVGRERRWRRRRWYVPARQERPGRLRLEGPRGRIRRREVGRCGVPILRRPETVAAGSGASSASENTIVARGPCVPSGRLEDAGAPASTAGSDSSTRPTMWRCRPWAIGWSSRTATSPRTGPTSGAGANNTDLYVRAFRYDAESGDWAPLGENMRTNYPGVKSGYFIAPSDGGGVIGMGDPRVGPRTAARSAAALTSTSTGRTLGTGARSDRTSRGEAAGDMFGYQGLHLGGDGRHLLVGAPSSRGNGFEHGRARVYRVPDHV